MQSEPSRSAPTFTVTDLEKQHEADRLRWRAQTPEERLDAVERLRLEAGSFLHEYAEYPSRLRRLLTIAGRTPR